MPGRFSWGWSEEVIRPLTQVRCKRQEFTQWFSLFWQQVDALKYDGSFRVCYVPGQRIDSVTYVRGDASWTQLGLTWLGNDAGYPTYAKNTTNVVFQWRGSVAICLVSPLCSVRKHPWVRVTFFANNTMTKEAGVV